MIFQSIPKIPRSSGTFWTPCILNLASYMSFTEAICKQKIRVVKKVFVGLFQSLHVIAIMTFKLVMPKRIVMLE